VTWETYGRDLERNLQDLLGRVHRGGYRAKPTRRAWIPKSDGRQRPLGIAALEDKVLQRAVVEVLNGIYETDFVGFSYGFGPGRSAHDALDALAAGIYDKKVNWVLDADIRDFFTGLDHGWLLKFLEHRVADRRVLPVSPERSGRSSSARCIHIVESRNSHRVAIRQDLTWSAHCGAGPMRDCWSYTQMLWTRLRRKAAYLPG
jgi:retron-type reverse transcriptase